MDQSPVVVVIDDPVAIIVAPVAHLLAWDPCVGIVAIPLASREAIAVVIITFVDLAVAVIVLPIAELRGTWINGRVGIIAVDAPPVPIVI